MIRTKPIKFILHDVTEYILAARAMERVSALLGENGVGAIVYENGVEFTFKWNRAGTTITIWQQREAA